MIFLQGKYGNAKIFTKNLDNNARDQIQELIDQKMSTDLKIRIMPDVHAGIGCVIGTTMNIDDKIVPNLVGLDIGCGIKVAKLKDKNLDLKKLDETIKNIIPSGFNIRKTEHILSKKTRIYELKSLSKIDIKRAKLSIGTLGGGNHFIEIGKNEENQLYLLIHTGSRNLGKQVAEYYQKIAKDKFKEKERLRKRLIKEIKENNDENLLKKLEDINEKLSVPKNLQYIMGKDMENYLHDMEIVQEYSSINRDAIMYEIKENMDIEFTDSFTTIHNYINTEENILRKGAVSANTGEKLIIPFNMKDGSIICEGRGNKDWNNSAPHGAGRKLSRNEAIKKLTMESFQKEMEDIYSTSVNKKTLDEHPQAYKDKDSIIEKIKETVIIKEYLKPIYNYKSS